MSVHIEHPRHNEIAEVVQGNEDQIPILMTSSNTGLNNARRPFRLSTAGKLQGRSLLFLCMSQFISIPFYTRPMSSVGSIFLPIVLRVELLIAKPLVHRGPEPS
ncbi:hypothetical protein Acr_29g0000070 [Actinidia rufa]|uniref:Uncharacterized protein n=1 Tax=Actinidia rufa TaxID=165716 RepID=A0A7J0HCY8_9ERIC|nr:hypothetical protein Acr_29g0000070 [Actinidia rufa]